MPKYEELKGKVGIVTGAGRGIGRAIAQRLAREGVSVVVTDIDQQSAETTADEIRSAEGKAIGFKVDVTHQDEVERMVSRTVSEFGALNILVNNAGVGAVAPILETDEKTWEWVMNVNAKGVFLCSKAAAKQMIQQGKGGRIITNASGAGKMAPGKGTPLGSLRCQQTCRCRLDEAIGARAVFPPNPGHQHLRRDYRHPHVGPDRS